MNENRQKFECDYHFFLFRRVGEGKGFYLLHSHMNCFFSFYVPFLQISLEQKEKKLTKKCRLEELQGTGRVGTAFQIFFRVRLANLMPRDRALK